MPESSPVSENSISASSRRKPQKLRSSRRRLVRCAVIMGIYSLFGFLIRNWIFEPKAEVEFGYWFNLLLSFGLYLGLARGNRICRWLTITLCFLGAAGSMITLCGIGLMVKPQVIGVPFYLILGVNTMVPLLVGGYLLMSEGIAREIQRLNP